MPGRKSQKGSPPGVLEWNEEDEEGKEGSVGTGPGVFCRRGGGGGGE